MQSSIGYQNVKTFGAVGDGITNDRTAIGNAIAAAQAAGGGVVFFPPGTYNIVRTNSNPIYLLSGAAQGNILFLGCGASSILSVSGDASGTGDMELFQLFNGCLYVAWKSLAFTAEALANPGEQSHFLSWRGSGLGPTETGRAVVLDCYFGYTEGDSIRFLGNQLSEIRHVKVLRNCFRVRNTISGRGGRSCLGYQRATLYTVVDANYMRGVRGQLIDFEPTGTGENDGDRLIRNFGDRETIPNNIAVTLTGNSGTQEHKRSIFAGNIIINGGLEGFDLANFIIADNIVQCPNSEEQGTSGFNERQKGLVYTGNMLYLVSTLTGINCLSLANHTVGDNRRDVVEGNLMVNASDVNGSFAITANDVTDVIIAGNQWYVAVNTNGAGGLIAVEGPDEADDNVSIVENLGVGTDARLGIGSRAGAAGPFTTGNITMSDNLYRNVDVGVRFGPDSAATRAEQLCAARNVLQANTSAVVVTGTVVPEVNVDAGGQGNGPTIFQVTSDPSGAVVANKGSFALRTNGGAGTTLYVKEADSGLNTGWAAK
jgi:hypothetical protein